MHRGLTLPPSCGHIKVALQIRQWCFRNKSCATRTKMNPFMLIPTLLEGPGFLFCVVKDLGVLIFV